MFERFSVKARQSVFFARYAASEFGSPQIESEHFLLGVFRADADLAKRLAGDFERVEAIRKRVETESPKHTRISTSIDLPLSADSRQAMSLAAEESATLHHDHIGPAHLLIGLLRVADSLASRCMTDSGIALDRLRDEANRSSAGPAPPPVESGIEKPAPEPLHIEGARDLTAAARQGRLEAVVGREAEVDLLVTILCRRRRNCAAVIGEPGAGKSAVVAGLSPASRNSSRHGFSWNIPCSPSTHRCSPGSAGEWSNGWRTPWPRTSSCASKVCSTPPTPTIS
jgi:ATP-dependent Clp protease ATP-binding subunit ClpC